MVESGCNVGDSSDLGSFPVSGRSPGEGTDYQFHCSCLENPMDKSKTNKKPLKKTFYSSILELGCRRFPGATVDTLV